MREFVVYAGPDAGQDVHTRRKVRSQAMRDFRRRQRTENMIASRAQGIDHEHCDGRAKQNARQIERRTTSELDQPDSATPMSNDDTWGLTTGERTLLPKSPSHGSSIAASSAIPAFHTLVDHDFDVPGSNLPSNTGTLLAVQPSAQGQQICPNCLSHNDDCSICTLPRILAIQNGQESDKPTPSCDDTTDLGITSMSLYSMSSLTSCDAREQSALQYFQCVVAKDVSGIVAVGFWERLVPRMCQMEDAARQAAIALSEVHLMQTTGGSFSGRTSSQGHLGLLSNLESEIKASNALRRYIEDSTSPSHELVLTCSVMLYTLESILGRETSASLHLENGLKMFKAWQERRKHSGSKVSETSDSLSTAFARLDLSATIADDDRLPVFEYDDGLFPMMSDQTLAPQMSFTSSHEAHHQLMRIGTPAWAFMMRNQHWRKTYARFVPKELIEEQRMHMSRYRNWSMIMDMYEAGRMCYGAAERNTSEHDRRAEVMSLLATRMHHWCAKRLLEESIRNEQDFCVWDRSPQKLLRYAKAIFGYTEEVRAEKGHQGQTSFSPEIGISGILLCLAHRTALPHIRSEALELAQRFGRKEGARDFCSAFTAWTQLPYPRPKFTFMMGEPGH
jgi:hypothetical protein